jgi:hypothetical protein
MKSELAEMQAELRREAQEGRTLAPDHLASLVAARLTAAAKRRSGQCVRCGDGIDPKRTSLCAWCYRIEQARKEAQMRRDDLEFAKQGYQILGPRGGRLWTRNGDPGGSELDRGDYALWR